MTTLCSSPALAIRSCEAVLSTPNCGKAPSHHSCYVAVPAASRLLRYQVVFSSFDATLLTHYHNVQRERRENNSVRSLRGVYEVALTLNRIYLRSHIK